MATIGQPLVQPEEGWKRYDDTDSAIKYDGIWITENHASYFKGSSRYSEFKNTNCKLTFKFKGTKIRILAPTYINKPTDIPITIDGVTEIFNGYSSSIVYNQVLIYEKTELTDAIHTVTISTPSSVATINNGDIQIDAIDIDSTGNLLHPDEVTDIKDLEVGKRIRCHYQTSTANTVGTFSNLGKATSDFIPVTSSNVPNGDFYFICVDNENKKKKLIADRNIQHSISWDTLNSAGIASGSGLPLAFNSIGVMTGYESKTLKIADNGFTSGSYGTYYGWKVFDGANGNGDKWASDILNISNSSPAELLVEFKDRKEKIVSLTISPPPAVSSNSSAHPKRFKLQASNDSLIWEDIFEHVNGIKGIKTRFVFDNRESYSFYKFIVSEAEGTGAGVQIGELEFESLPYESITATIRLLTGGINNTDKDNEWDKYIVGSTLNGSIVAGDNNVWNWSGVYSWSSTSSVTPSNRIARGNTAVGNLGAYVTSSTGGTSSTFRPVLVIEDILKTYTFIKINNQYKSFKNNQWNTVSTTLPSESVFVSDGIQNLSILDRKETKFTQDMTNNGSLGEGKVFKSTIDLKKLFEITKIEVE
jgi:hypothetical protein